MSPLNRSHAHDHARSSEKARHSGGGGGGGSSSDSASGGRPSASPLSLLERLKLVDAYAAGAVLHETCALVKPFEATTLQLLLEAIVSGSPSDFPLSFSDGDQSLRQLAARMICRQPTGRLSVAAAMRLPHVERQRQRLEAMPPDLLATAVLPTSASTSASGAAAAAFS